jgi:hypothetical protein
MIAEEAVRFLAHEARRCRDRDSHEALCLLLPAMLQLLALEPMNDFEALDFALGMRHELSDQVNPEPVTHAA